MRKASRLHLQGSAATSLNNLTTKLSAALITQFQKFQPDHRILWPVTPDSRRMTDLLELLSRRGSEPNYMAPLDLKLYILLYKTK